ncbi:MAG TPA: hypothetical protein VJ323_17050, partial [Bryobacteraceae bacterium]|nr:hypothetical protein [Bryobacteraceae bacterium]
GEIGGFIQAFISKRRRSGAPLDVRRWNSRIVRMQRDEVKADGHAACKRYSLNSRLLLRAYRTSIDSFESIAYS